ncbi:cytidine deaminase [Tothia fuscella]|uniref:Cytidine deaminase n=1 Tax=Tothia fuscella TaxID=1048955 RepID=A0A9P4P1H2_9PEZI|nr:cytidine deaminase [Tothia fuscella]
MAAPKESQKNLIHGLTTEEVTQLSRRSIDAKLRAYCPYSRFRVGATLLLKEGHASLPAATTDLYISGVNVENAAYPVGICAERCALGTAVASGIRYGAFKALAVATNTEPGKPASPCGMCRQFIREFCEPDMPIFMHDKNGDYVVQTLEQLLPMSFGPDALPSPEHLVAMEKES